MILDKFLASYIDFVDKHFGRAGHHYVFITSEKYNFGLTPEHKVEFLHTDDDIFITLLEYMKIAKKIIIHGLWRDKVDILLYFNQKLLKKCYWAMWGGDFYFPETKSKIRHEVIKKMGNCMTYIKDDYELAQNWYGAKGKYHKSFMYPSNLYKEYAIQPIEHSCINIQLGNSADPTNDHINALEKLAEYKDENIQIFTPLSYGNKEHATRVTSKGKEIFGEKFKPLTEFIPFEKYLDFLSTIDVAIFAHKRQQAFGNIIALLGLGKKVYINPNSVLFDFFVSHDIKIFDIYSIDLKPVSQAAIESNKNKLRKLFSEKALLDELKIIFNDNSLISPSH